jgi:RNA polymerase sigma-70 factor (ECF subfamily)
MAAPWGVPALPHHPEAVRATEGGLDLDARYSEILQREGAALWRTAAAYEADPARCEDLFQEICLAIWRALPRFRGEASERTFVFRVAHNRGLTHRSRRRPDRVRTADLEEAERLVDPRPGPETMAAEEQRRECLRRAVLALPLEPRQVLTLALEGLSHGEIATVLGITENYVAVRLSRARRALRQRLETAGDAP